jgi:hypothetical protein
MHLKLGRLPHNAAVMFRAAQAIFITALGLALSACVTRSVDVKPAAANPADFAGWPCEKIQDELDAVQQRAADVAYAVDQRAGNNILALGVGVTVFWPALLAMRPDGLEAQDLARLKGRFEALRTAERLQNCAPASAALPPARAALLPVAQGERLVYQERRGARGPLTEVALRLTATRRGELEYRLDSEILDTGATWLQDRLGNVLQAPPGALAWPQLLRGDLALGQVVAGDVLVTGDPLARARMRGQVVAVGPQTIAQRRFDVAVVELFGDAAVGDAYTRVDGAVVIDRTSGVLLRLDLRSANPAFSLQRRLVRVDAPR